MSQNLIYRCILSSLISQNFLMCKKKENLRFPLYVRGLEGNSNIYELEIQMLPLVWYVFLSIVISIKLSIRL